MGSGVGPGNGQIMVIRLGLLTALLAAALPIVRMTRLIRFDASTQWPFLVAGGFLLGMLLTWTIAAYRRSLLLILGINLVAVGLVLVTYLAPGTTWGVLPTAATIPVLSEELGFALELLRFGTAPVLPVPGLIGALGGLFWLFGAIAAWTLDRSRALLAIVGPSVLYLQLATIDRTPSGPRWIAAFLVMIALALLVTEIDERRRSTGRLHARSGALLRRTAMSRSLGYLAALVGVVTVVALTVATMVPASGLLDWRSRSGIGTGIYGGVSYNLFVSTIQTDLISLSEEPVFIARTSDPDGARRTFWRLITLERYDGTNWFPGVLGTGEPADVGRWERDDHTYQGNTQVIDQRIRILSLQQNYIPHVYSPIDIATDNRILAESYRIREDGAIKFDALTSEGLEYTVRSVVPDDPLTELASEDGEFSPMFQLAANDGQFAGTPSALREQRSRPQNISVYVDLPATLDERIVDKAIEVTELGVTDFERGLLLEAFYRSPREFLYSVDIEPGHSATDLAAWLFDPESANFRTGYCEQFATGMAVMARAIGIPARVVLGFTPGEVTDDGLITVRQKNAHAWVELWIDNHGWVQFDPTPRGDGVNPGTTSLLAFDPSDYALPAPDDPLAELPSGLPGVDDGLPNIPIPELLAAREAQLEGANAVTPGQVGVGPVRLPEWWWRIPASSVVLVLVPAVKWIRRRWRLRRLLNGDIEAAWNEVTDQLRDVGVWRIPEMVTPQEFAAASLPQMEALAAHYGEQLWSESGKVTATMIRESSEAFHETERTLHATVSWPRRVLGWWNPRSVVKRALRPFRRR